MGSGLVIDKCVNCGKDLAEKDDPEGPIHADGRFSCAGNSRGPYAERGGFKDQLVKSVALDAQLVNLQRQEALRWISAAMESIEQGWLPTAKARLEAAKQALESKTYRVEVER